MDQLIKRGYLTYNTKHMTQAEKIKILCTFELFTDLEEEVLIAFAERMHYIGIPQMKIFVEEGVDADKAFFIYSGIASVYRTSLEGEVINVEFRGSPDIVGKTGLIDNKISSTSAIAVTSIEALYLAQEDFVTLVNQYPEFALQMLRHFIDKMHGYATFLEDLLTSDLYHRTYQMLHYIASYFPGKEINLSQEELASLLWGTRARVTEVLDRLAEEGKITIAHRKITVL